MLYRREFGSIPVQVEHDKALSDISATSAEDKKAPTGVVVNPTGASIDLSPDRTGTTVSGQVQGRCSG